MLNLTKIYQSILTETTSSTLNCPDLNISDEVIDYVNKFNSSEELLRKGGLPIDMLDRLAFGFSADDIKTLHPNKLKIKWKDDLDNVIYQLDKSKLNKVEWAKKIDLSEPIDVSYNGKYFYIEDGHHRYYAAKILNKPLNINLEIKANPIVKLNLDLSYDNFHRCLFNQIKSNLN